MALSLLDILGAVAKAENELSKERAKLAEADKERRAKMAEKGYGVSDYSMVPNLLSHLAPPDLSQDIASRQAARQQAMVPPQLGAGQKGLGQLALGGQMQAPRPPVSSFAPPAADVAPQPRLMPQGIPQRPENVMDVAGLMSGPRFLQKPPTSLDELRRFRMGPEFEAKQKTAAEKQMLSEQREKRLTILSNRAKTDPLFSKSVTIASQVINADPSSIGLGQEELAEKLVTLANAIHSQLSAGGVPQVDGKKKVTKWEDVVK